MTPDLATLLAPSSLPEDAVEVARIGEPWGVRGWFKIIPYSTAPDALQKAKTWHLLPAERGARHFGGVLDLPVRQVRAHGDGLVAQSAAIETRDSAELLKGARIFLPRSAFPAPAEGEYYWVDLIGCVVRNREGVELGVVKDLLSMGPQTTLVLEAAAPEGEDARPVERLIPFVDAFVDEVDTAGHHILVDWQPDY